MNAVIQALTRGDLAILPTETVYGLAARADDPTAIEKIYATKGRGFDKPLALCVTGMEQAKHFGEFSPLAETLAQTFWPGPLSIIVPAKPDFPLDRRLMSVSPAGHNTISFRCPQAEWLSHLPFPIVLTSANRSGDADSLTLASAQDALGSDITALGADAPVGGQASTIIAIEGQCATLLRHGSLNAESFARFKIDWI